MSEPRRPEAGASEADGRGREEEPRPPWSDTACDVRRCRALIASRKGRAGLGWRWLGSCPCACACGTGLPRTMPCGLPILCPSWPTSCTKKLAESCRSRPSPPPAVGGGDGDRAWASGASSPACMSACALFIHRFSRPTVATAAAPSSPLRRASRPMLPRMPLSRMRPLGRAGRAPLVFSPLSSSAYGSCSGAATTSLSTRCELAMWNCSASMACASPLFATALHSNCAPTSSSVASDTWLGAQLGL